MGVFGAAVWVVRCASSIPATLIENATLILILLVLGASLIFTRYAIIAFAPGIGDNAVFWTNLLDGTLDILEALAIVMELSVEVIIAAFKILSGKTPHIDKPKFTSFDLNATELAAITREISYSCKDYDTLGMILGTIMKQGLSPFVCPLIRYTYPLRPVFPVAVTMLGWLSYDAAPWPFGGKDLSEPGNCVPPNDDYIVMCAFIGTGFVIIELVVPIFIFIILATTGIWTALLNLIFEGVVSCVLVSSKVIHNAFLKVRGIAKRLSQPLFPF